MNEALELIYYMFNEFLDFMFGAYLFKNISVGMFFIVTFIFMILLRYVMAIPRVRVGGSNGQSGKNNNSSSGSSNAGNQHAGD